MYPKCRHPGEKANKPSNRIPGRSARVNGGVPAAGPARDGTSVTLGGGGRPPSHRLRADDPSPEAPKVRTLQTLGRSPSPAPTGSRRRGFRRRECRRRGVAPSDTLVTNATVCGERSPPPTTGKPATTRHLGQDYKQWRVICYGADPPATWSFFVRGKDSYPVLRHPGHIQNRATAATRRLVFFLPRLPPTPPATPKSTTWASRVVSRPGRCQSPSVSVASCHEPTPVGGGKRARVAELADAQDLGSCTERCGGSIPPLRTIFLFFVRPKSEFGRNLKPLPRDHARPDPVLHW